MRTEKKGSNGAKKIVPVTHRRREAKTSARATSVVGTGGDAPSAASAETHTSVYYRASKRSDVGNILTRLAKD